MKILIVDDDDIFRNAIKRILAKENHEFTTANSAEKALSILESQNFDIVLTDLKMRTLSGIDLLKRSHKAFHDTIFIMLTGYGTIETAVEAMRFGAFDYILKPAETTELATILKQKIKEATAEITLRKEMHRLSAEETADLPLYSSDSLENELCVPPFLLIYDESSKNIKEKLKLPNLSSFVITYNEKLENAIAPTKLHLIEAKLTDFIKNNPQGTIILKGIEKLLQVYQWDQFKFFLMNLQKTVTPTHSLILLLDQKTTEDPIASLLRDAISVLANQKFANIVDILSHTTRKNIIKALNSEIKLNFNRIAKSIEESKSQNLAFHLNKLVSEKIVEKDENDYILTQRGKFLAKIIFDLETAGLLDPFSHIKAFKLAE